MGKDSEMGRKSELAISPHRKLVDAVKRRELMEKQANLERAKVNIYVIITLKT
jgi:hypothetical protein